MKKPRRITGRMLSFGRGSKPHVPAFLEKLEPRILLSGDGLPSADALDALLDTTPQVVQHAELLEASEPVEQPSAVQLEIDREVSPSCPGGTDLLQPILTLSVEVGNVANDAEPIDASSNSADGFDETVDSVSFDETAPAQTGDDLLILSTNSDSSTDNEAAATEIACIIVARPTTNTSAVLVENGSTPIYSSDTDLDSEYATSIEIRGPPAQAQAPHVNQIVFVDSTLEHDFQAENAGYSDVVVNVLLANTDGIQYITDILSSYKDLSAIHIVTLHICQ